MHLRSFVTYVAIAGCTLLGASRLHAEEAAPAAASAAPAASASAPAHAGSATANAAKPQEEEDDTSLEASKDRKGEIQQIGLVVTGLNKIDPVKCTFEFEGLVTIRTKGAIPKCDKAKMGQLFDGEIKKAEEVDEDLEADGTKSRTCKVAVEIADDIDVKRYPFDVQELTILVGDVGDALDGVQYTVNEQESGLGDKVRLSGWDVDSLHGTAVNIKEPTAKKDISQAAFTLTVKRPKLTSFVKGLLAVTFQLLIGLVAILLRVKNITNRISMATGALIAVAATHNQISTQLGVAYLTTADKFFMASYFLLLLNIGISVLMLRAEDEKQEAKVNSLFKTSLWLMPVATVVTTVIALVT